MPMVLARAARHVKRLFGSKMGFSFSDFWFCYRIFGLVFQSCRFEHCWKSKGLGTVIFWNSHSPGLGIFEFSYPWWSCFTFTRALLLPTEEVAEDSRVPAKLEILLFSHWTQVITIGNSFDSSVRVQLFLKNAQICMIILLRRGAY